MRDKIITHPKGAIYFAEISKNIPDENNKINTPCVIISNDSINANSDNITIAIISEYKEKCENQVEFISWTGTKSVVQCNNIYTVSKKKLTNKCYGMLPKSIMKEVDNQVALALGISRNVVDLSEITKAVNELVDIKKQEVKTSKIESKNIEDKDAEVEDTNNEDNKTDSKIESKKEKRKYKKSEKTLIQENINRSEFPARKPKGFWTEERMKLYVADKESMSLTELKDKWNMSNSQVAYQAYYRFKKELGIVQNAKQQREGATSAR